MKKISPWQWGYAILYILGLCFVLLLLSGDWFWLEGWVFNLWFLALCFGVIAYLRRKDPALLAERFKKPGMGKQKGWDVLFVYALQFVFLAWFALMPLDAKRFGWTLGFPWEVKFSGGVALLISSFLMFRAYADNTFLSPLVRVQKEREQKVVSTGVYGFVRHPLYLGAVLLFFGAPLLLGSKWGMAAGALLALMLVVRIHGEERMLSKELQGYAAYREKVRYRLVPYLW